MQQGCPDKEIVVLGLFSGRCFCIHVFKPRVDGNINV